MRTAYEAVIDGTVKEFIEPKRLEYSTIKHEELIKVVYVVKVVCVFWCDFLSVFTANHSNCNQMTSLNVFERSMSFCLLQ